MIRSTFAATPTRRRVLAAKAWVTAAFVFPVALLITVVSFEVGQRIFAGKHLEVSFAHPGVLQAVVLCPGGEPHRRHRCGIGGLIRHTAAATTTLVLVIVGGVTLGQLLPAGLRQYVPGTALEAAVTVNHSAGLLRPALPLWSWASCRHRPGGGLHPDVPGRRLTRNRTDRPAPGPTNLNRLEKSMNNALRTRQRMFALALPSPQRSTSGPRVSIQRAPTRSSRQRR